MWFRKQRTDLEAFNTEDTIQFGSAVIKSSQTQSGGKSLLNKEWWYSKVMDWSMKSTDFKTRMFRFVDVFPYLHSGNDLLNHVNEYFADDQGNLPPLFQFGSSVGQLAPGLVSKSVEKNIKDMARLFITGENPQDAIKKLRENRKKRVAFTADLLGELTLSENEALDYKKRYLELIEEVHKDSLSWEHDELIDENHLGPIPKVNVSVKMSSLYSQIKVQAWEESKHILVERLSPIFKRAMELGVFLNVDMEHYEYKDLTLDVFSELILKPEFKDYPHWGIVLQAYLKDSYQDCERMIALAKKRGVPFSIRLVKGAYWDFEVIHAKQNAWPVPVYTTKENSDYNYEKCAKLLLKNHSFLFTALASHNIRSLSESLVFAKKHNVPQKSYEIQMLYGMADQFKQSFIDLGYRIREYATIGDLVPGMAYLVRRLLENSSNQSFLQSDLKKDQDLSSLLGTPHFIENETEVLKSRGFSNAPLLDFSIQENRSRFQNAIDSWVEEFKTPVDVCAFVNGGKVVSDQKIKRHAPNAFDQNLYNITNTPKTSVDEALDSAFQFQKTWAKTPAKIRVDLINKVADLLERDRIKLAALQTIEVGKPWKEADGDLTEAIDFCRYYAKDMEKLSQPFKVGGAPGEESFYHYRARGVVGVIAPWNFPLAILCGMTVSALVTGNTVLMKPAEQSSLTALKLFEILMEAGIPKEACHFLPGLGEKVGAQIVESPKVSVVSFTGSKEVGLNIVKKISEVQTRQQHVKKAVIEMGGKNALIIDTDADLDQAVSGALYSAFAFSGQKCSALSRLIVLDPIYDRFCKRLKEATQSLEVKQSTNPKAYLGPVVDKVSFERIQKTIEKNKKLFEHTSCAQFESDGNFVSPHIFFDVDATSDLAQEEVFGPVLAVIKVKDIDEAVAVANNSKYALTAGIYSRMPSHIEKVKEDLDCGNLYINRSITGAMVDRHPFGGYKLSGLGSKTGGPDYLKNFLEPRVMTENLVRQGFSPDLLEENEA